MVFDPHSARQSVSMVVTRSAATSVSELLPAFRLVPLGGARQTGKTTLVRELLDLPTSARASLDDAATLRRALGDRRASWKRCRGRRPSTSSSGVARACCSP
jgi:predicted AAA+ superfamily ATPase